MNIFKKIKWYFCRIKNGSFFKIEQAIIKFDEIMVKACKDWNYLKNLYNVNNADEINKLVYMLSDELIVNYELNNNKDLIHNFIELRIKIELNKISKDLKKFI